MLLELVFCCGEWITVILSIFFHNALYKLANDSTHASASKRKLLLAEWAFKPKPIANSPGLIDPKRGASGPRANVLVASDGEKQRRLKTGDKGEGLFKAQKKNSGNFKDGIRRVIVWCFPASSLHTFSTSLHSPFLKYPLSEYSMHSCFTGHSDHKGNTFMSRS